MRVYKITFGFKLFNLRCMFDTLQLKTSKNIKRFLKTISVVGGIHKYLQFLNILG